MTKDHDKPAAKDYGMYRSMLAVGSFAAMAAGFWLAWPPLGLIVPGTIVFTLLVFSHLRGID